MELGEKALYLEVIDKDIYGVRTRGKEVLFDVVDQNGNVSTKKCIYSPRIIEFLQNEVLNTAMRILGKFNNLELKELDEKDRMDIHIIMINKTIKVSMSSNIVVNYSKQLIDEFVKNKNIDSITNTAISFEQYKKDGTIKHEATDIVTNTGGVFLQGNFVSNDEIKELLSKMKEGILCKAVK